MADAVPGATPDALPPRVAGGSLPNGFLFWPGAAFVVVLDVVTKAIAAATLFPPMIPHPVLGDFARLTLVYNRGAAFGLHVGTYSRPIFVVLTIGALTILWRLYRASAPADWRRVLALALVSAGAVGNLIDRLRSPRGVVDFIDLGTESWRWPTFNVADIAVTTGAILLAVVLWREDRAAARAAGAAGVRASAEPLSAMPGVAPVPPPGAVPGTTPVDVVVPVTAERRGIA